MAFMEFLGRLEMHIALELPCLRDRQAIIKEHTHDKLRLESKVITTHY